MKLLTFFAALALIPANASAGETAKPLDPASQQALRQTEQMLNSPTERQKALDRDPRAKAVDSQARQALGDENMADVYALAAELMGTLSNEAGGDPVKLMELMEKAEKNPEILEGKLTPAEMAKLRSIAGRIPAAAPQSPPAKQK